MALMVSQRTLTVMQDCKHGHGNALENAQSHMLSAHQPAACAPDVRSISPAGMAAGGKLTGTGFLHRWAQVIS